MAAKVAKRSNKAVSSDNLAALAHNGVNEDSVDEMPDEEDNAEEYRQKYGKKQFSHERFEHAFGTVKHLLRNGNLELESESVIDTFPVICELFALMGSTFEFASFDIRRKVGILRRNVDQTVEEWKSMTEEEKGKVKEELIANLQKSPETEIDIPEPSENVLEIKESNNIESASVVPNQDECEGVKKKKKKRKHKKHRKTPSSSSEAPSSKDTLTNGEVTPKTKKVNFQATSSESADDLPVGKTCQTFMRYELGRGKGKSTQDFTRTLWRLSWAYDFIIAFLEELQKEEDANRRRWWWGKRADPNKKVGKPLRNCAYDAYLTALAPHHPWPIRQIVKLAVYALPNRESLFSTFGVPDGEEARKIMNGIIDVLRPTRDELLVFFKAHDVIQLT